MPVLSAATVRRNRIAALGSALAAADHAFDAIEGGPLSDEEARQALAILAKLQQKLQAGRNHPA